MKSGFYKIALGVLSCFSSSLTFGNTGNGLVGSYHGKEWGLLKWGEPCKVEIDSMALNNLNLYTIGIYVNRDGYPDYSWQTVVQTNWSDSEELDSIMLNSETTKFSFTDKDVDYYIPLTRGGKLWFENGALKQAYIWNVGWYVIPGKLYTCGLLEKEL